MTNYVWIVFTKSKPLDGCSINIDGCEFYFSEVYVPFTKEVNGACSFENIIGKAKSALVGWR